MSKAASERTYFVSLDRENSRGPYTLDQVKTLWNNGTIPACTFFWDTAVKKWEPIQKLLGGFVLPAPQHSSHSSGSLVALVFVGGLIIVVLTISGIVSWLSPSERPRFIQPPQSPMATYVAPRLFTPIPLIKTVERPSHVPYTNSVLWSGIDEAGAGVLLVDNGTSDNAYVKLVDIASGRTCCFFFVKANSTFELQAIPDGEYQLVFAFGGARINGTMEILDMKYANRFVDPLDFITLVTESETQRNTSRTRLSVTLHAVPHGNEQSASVPLEDFNLL